MAQKDTSNKITFPENFNLADYYLFDRLKEGFSKKTAIEYGDRSYSYASVAEKTRSLANYFQAIGVSREERVYIVLPDVPPFAWSFFATLAHGAVVAMGNPAAPVADLEYVIDYSRASVLITTPKVILNLSSSLRKNQYLKAILLVPETATGENPESNCLTPHTLINVRYKVLSLSKAIETGRENEYPTSLSIRRDDLGVWLFTSGSTGKPKAAVHTHRDFAFNTEVYAKRTVGYQADDRSVSVPRLFFGYSTGTNLMFPFAVGATTCLYSEQPTPENLAKAIEMYRPTIITNVPTMMSKLLEYDDSLSKAGKAGLDLSSVRFHLSAGEALPPTLLERFTARFGNEVYDGIGSAEMFHIYASNRPGDVKPGSLGRVVEGYTIKILPTDAEGPGAEALPANSTGVMWVKGDSVALGYFQDRDKSWETFHGHWCKTGDLFRLDAEGYLWFSGRDDSLFKVGGKWVAPLEVETCLQEHPAVAMAAVIPAIGDGLDKPKAFVVVRENELSQISNEKSKNALRLELQNFVKNKLPKHKYPRWVVFVEDLPKNDRGKVDRKRLIEQEKVGQNPWR